MLSWQFSLPDILASWFFIRKNLGQVQPIMLPGVAVLCGLVKQGLETDDNSSRHHELVVVLD